MAELWRCPDCGAEHRCDGDGGAPAQPGDPDTGPAPIVVNVKVEGSLIDERTLGRMVQQAMLRSRVRNPTNKPGET